MSRKWQLAPAVKQFVTDVNRMFPTRSKASDGGIGDVAHSARTSDHNPDDDGDVCAFDITHDPKNGLNSEIFANALLVSKDPRIKYVISNRKIASGAKGQNPWMWRRYIGKNPHDHHVHLSVLQEGKNDIRPWTAVTRMAKHIPTLLESVTIVKPKLKMGSSGPFVMQLQIYLGFPNTTKDRDGKFGPKVKEAVIAIQKKAGLEPDGIVGAQTWKVVEGRA